MWNLHFVLCLLLLCCSSVFVAGQRSSNATSKWLTLSGNAPLVVARGGFSGLFPDSSFNAYAFAQATSLENYIAWCDVQLTKDMVGICLPDVKLNNASDIETFFPNRKNSTYLVNGAPLQGWFSVDFTFKDLTPVTLKQGVFSRSQRFDATPQQILTVQDVATQIKPPGLWLNIQHDSFYSQHNLSMRSFVISLSRSVIVNYISSPEVKFLQSITTRFNPRVTKRVFRFLGKDDMEPSLNQTYDSLLKNLTFVKTFASGILVPKYYIWPVEDSKMYLQPHTSVVSDAHKEGLEVFASDFVNDVPFAYNYSYDPVAEYLSFIDNGEFSVDGVLSDFPITPSESVGCFSHMGKNDKPQVNVLIIALEGASGDFPGCTHEAYTKAATDGADVLGCPVQMTKDGIPFCLGSINLIDKTTVAQSPFGNNLTSFPALNVINGILTISLNWKEIQTLRPAISTPWLKFRLSRNPNARNVGQFMSLADFLTFAKNATSVSRVLIGIENARFLASQGFGVKDAVSEALSKAGYDNLTAAKKVMIKSTDSSVLQGFKRSNYELVYEVSDDIRDVDKSTMLEIKTFAKSVIISKKSIFPVEDAFIISQTDVVQKLQSSNLTVYGTIFNNEFVSQAWDFFSDSSVELNNYVFGVGLNGVITEFPLTADRYRRNRCLGFNTPPPPYMTPIQPGGLLGLIAPQLLPPAEAPNPVLTESDVVEPPLPPVAKINPSDGNGTANAPITPPNGQSSVVSSILMSSVAILLAIFLVC